MPFKSPELSHEHHLEGMVRCGRVTKVKTSTSVAATVTYPDRGFQSPYLLVLQRNTIGYQDYYVPVEGEPVWVLMQGKSLNRGLILGSAYTDGSPPPFNSQTIRGMKFADGSYIIYDTAGGGNYQINTKGQVTITAASTVTITVPNIKLAGNVEVTGVLTVDQNVAIKGSLNTTGNSYAGTRTGGPI
jgi:phage baseplate assembly protein V